MFGQIYFRQRSHVGERADEDVTAEDGYLFERKRERVVVRSVARGIILSRTVMVRAVRVKVDTPVGSTESKAELLVACVRYVVRLSDWYHYEVQQFA